MSGAPIVSHGRGGQGNIGPDDTKYVDGGIVRTGPEGDQGDGAYSAGRGGAGNIGSPGVRPVSAVPHDKDVVPEAAVRPSQDIDHHVGRGGQGNIEKAKKDDTPAKTSSSPFKLPMSLVEKLKKLLKRNK